MDIESKTYRLRSAAGSQAEITAKATGRAAFVARSTLPSVHSLAMMHERQFDQICAAAMGSASHV